MRAFEEFAVSELPHRVHNALIEGELNNEIISHNSRDSTAIKAREKAESKIKIEKIKKREDALKRGKKNSIQSIQKWKSRGP